MTIETKTNIFVFCVLFSLFMSVFLILSVFICMCMCVHIHVCRCGCHSVLCRGQKTVLSVRFSLSPCLRQGLLLLFFTALCAGPAGPQTSREFLIPAYHFFLRNTGVRVQCYCAQRFVNSGDSNLVPHALHSKHFAH